MDPGNQFEQLIERPGSVQPLPDRFQAKEPDVMAGVMVITNELFPASTPVEAIVTTLFAVVVMLLIWLTAPALTSAGILRVLGTSQEAILPWSWMHIEVAVFPAPAADIALPSLVRCV